MKGWTRRDFFMAASALGAAGLAVGNGTRPYSWAATTPSREANVMYQPRDYGKLIGMKGFSETLLKNHFALYQGYVTNTNKVAETLAAMHKAGKTSGPEYAELKRRFGWEFNGMRLHEHYFENLGGSGQINASGSLARNLSQAFGSAQNWESDFRAVGALRGIGWVVLYRDDASGNLFNAWINEHDAGHLAGCRPLLIMDVFEHAFMIDYGLKRGDYIQAFFQNLNWDAVEKRW